MSFSLFLEHITIMVIKTLILIILGELVTKKKSMFMNYLKGDFMLDLCVVSPFLMERFGFKSTNFFMLLRITRVKRMIDNVKAIFNF